MQQATGLLAVKRAAVLMLQSIGSSELPASLSAGSEGLCTLQLGAGCASAGGWKLNCVDSKLPTCRPWQESELAGCTSRHLGNTHAAGRAWSSGRQRRGWPPAQTWRACTSGRVRELPACSITRSGHTCGHRAGSPAGRSGSWRCGCAPPPLLVPGLACGLPVCTSQVQPI